MSRIGSPFSRRLITLRYGADAAFSNPPTKGRSWQILLKNSTVEASEEC
jgi:hypothetical protein